LSSLPVSVLFVLNILKIYLFCLSLTFGKLRQIVMEYYETVKYSAEWKVHNRLNVNVKDVQ